MRLDRLLAKCGRMGRKRARLLVAQARVLVDGAGVTDCRCEVDRFSRIEVDGRCIRQTEARIGIMLYKPIGVLSATKDDRRLTVIDLIDVEAKETLHLVGRLDRASSGLMLLTNDGNWSKALMTPSRKVPKMYEVETELPVSPESIHAFAEGFDFQTEGIHTLPARLELLGGRRSRVTLHEGRYHQIKRMFHRVGNRVTSLHRVQIGQLSLPKGWRPGQWRYLTGAEMELGQNLANPSSTG